MKIFTRYIASFAQAVILIFSLVTDWYTELSVSLGIVLLILILDKMGKGIVWRESTAMLYTVTCLLMPLLGYAYYTGNNEMARLWVKYMPVPESVYFGFSLPAISAFCLAITWPLGWSVLKDEGEKLKQSISEIKEILVNQKSMAISIVITGILLSLVTNYLPSALQFFANLFFFASFAGVLYIYYAPNFKHKRLVITAFVFFIFYGALRSGMFTVVAYMGITIYSFFLLSSNPSMFKKILILIFAVVFIVVLQNTKIAYRKIAWKTDYQDSKISLFGELFFESIQKGSALIEKNAFFSTYVRMNQGYNVALVMKRIPAYKPHDNGENLATAFGSAFVPRVLWPDKPEAGGKFNMKYYAGITLRGWSTNIGPLGEAYGSFGKPNGIIYMFLLGFLIRWCYGFVFKIARRIPLVICWIPVIFFQLISSAETDSLQIFNSLFKAAFFLWLIYKFLPQWFGISKVSGGEKLKTLTPG